MDLSSLSSYPISANWFRSAYRGELFDGTQVVIKTLRLPCRSQSEDDDNKFIERSSRELFIWSRCYHPNILPLLGLVEFQSQIRTVSLWMDNGNLPSYLESNPSVDRYGMSVQICKGLAYLHSVGIVHGDLKGRNILVSNEGVPMINDFGNAVLQKGGIIVPDTTQMSWHTPHWTAPEVMDERQSGSTRGADVYSLGMTILETITGKIPYSNKKNVHAIYVAKVITREIPTRPDEFIPPNDQYGNGLWSLLRSCWTHEPEERPDAGQVSERASICMTQAQNSIGPQTWCGQLSYACKGEDWKLQWYFNAFAIGGIGNFETGQWPQRLMTTAGFKPLSRARASHVASFNDPSGQILFRSIRSTRILQKYAIFHKIITAGYSIFYELPLNPSYSVNPLPADATAGSVRGLLIFSEPKSPNYIIFKLFKNNPCPSDLCQGGQTASLELLGDELWAEIEGLLEPYDED